MPDPITRATWDNYVTVCQDEAKEKGWKLGHVVKVTANGHSVELPMLLVPGQAKGTYGIAVGYGRTVTGKENLNGIGANVFPFFGADNGAGDVKVEPTGAKIKLAQTQTHHVLSSKQNLKDRTIIREGTLDNLEGLFGFIKHTR
jgi:molybdopterin-containing oxidoreductase family iron-sulfur binding subunit